MHFKQFLFKKFINKANYHTIQTTLLLATCNALKLKFKIFDFERYFLFKTVKNFYLLKFKKQFKKETVAKFYILQKKIY